MPQLKYNLRNDVLFKMVFTQYEGLLKALTAEILGIEPGSIAEFKIRNTEMPPENIGDKFCRLDINMTVNGERINIEIQNTDQKAFYAKRSLYYWARDYSTALPASEHYTILPRTVHISILAFPLFEGHEGYRSEFQLLETSRHKPLTDRLMLQYFELPKLQKPLEECTMLERWLYLLIPNRNWIATWY